MHQITLTQSSLLVTHSSSLSAALSAAKTAGIPPDRVIIIDSLEQAGPSIHVTVDELVAAGLTKQPMFVEKRLKPGEAKRKVALLCFSSGTTGKPKAVEVPHYAMVANVIQVALAIGSAPRYVPGDVALGGKRSFSHACN